MKTSYIYLLVICLLIYVSYARHKDNHQQQQQEAQVHRLYCSENPTTLNCK